MRQFVLRYLEPVTGFAFFLNILFWCFFGAATTRVPVDSALSAELLGALMGLVVGVPTSFLVAGTIYLLLSMNERLGKLQEPPQ